MDGSKADPSTQQAAMRIGGDHSHRISIEARRPDLTDTLKRIRSTSRVQAESALAPLNDAEVRHLADRMGVDTAGSPADVRQRIAERADANRQERLADGRQAATDSELLARADRDAEWVKGWTDADRQAAHEAAARLLARAAREPGWEFIRDRATRWARPADRDPRRRRRGRDD